MDMMNPARGIVVGVDAHTDTHDTAVLDDCGRLLATRTFPADAAGYRALLAWVQRFGRVVAFGVESTGSYAAGLVRHLRREGVEALEVNQPHAHTRRRRGKSDPIDAEMAARHVLAASRPVVARDTTGIVEAIRQLRVAREGAVKARSAALNALTGLVVTAPEDLRQQLLACKTSRGRATLCTRFRPDHRRLHEPEQAAKVALRSLARRVADLDAEVKALDRQLQQLVTQAAPITTARVAVSTGHAGTLLVTAGQNIGRLRHEASFAALCGASPIPVSTGRTDRHRLSYGGDRDANRALHMIAVCRLRYCERTRAYAERRTAEGRPRPRSSAASSATSHASSTTPSSPTCCRNPARRDAPIRSSPSPAAPERSDAPSGPLDIYRNVPAALRACLTPRWTRRDHHAPLDRHRPPHLSSFALRRILRAEPEHDGHRHCSRRAGEPNRTPVQAAPRPRGGNAPTATLRGGGHRRRGSEAPAVNRAGRQGHDGYFDVVIDDQSAFVTSANPTEAAFDRNIEVGVLSRDRALAASLARHFRVLIDQKLLRPLPSG